MANVEAVAKLCDMTPRRVQQLVKEGVLPRSSRGDYDAAVCVVSYIRYLKKLIDGQGGGSFTDQRTRLAKEQADKQEMENAVRRGELLVADEVVEAYRNEYQRCSVKLQALPTKLAPLISGAKVLSDIQLLLSTGINEALDELSLSD